MADKISTPINSLEPLEYSEITDALRIPVSAGTNKAMALTIGTLSERVLDKLRNTEGETVTVTMKCLEDLAAGSKLTVIINGDLGNPRTYDIEYGPDTDTYVSSFVVSVDLKYTVVFPDKAGFIIPESVTKIASLPERSIRAEYREGEETELTEVVVVTAWSWKSSVFTPLTGVTFDVEGTQFVTGDTGKITTEVPFGSTYTVKTSPVLGYYTRGLTERTFTADMQKRFITFNYSDSTTGIYIIDKDGTEWTTEDWTSAGDTVNPEDAVMIKFASQDLVDNNAVFGLLIDDIVAPGLANQKYSWCSNNLQFNSYPFGTSYLGYERTALLIEEASNRGFAVPAATFCWNKSYTIGDTVLHGFLPAVNQWMAVNNLGPDVDIIINLTRPDTPNSYKWTTGRRDLNKWSVDQSNATNAYYVNSGSNTNNKYYSNVVLPAYAF